MIVPADIRWNKDTEVVVIGYGLAGAVAAVTAKDRVAEVVMLEKQAADSRCTNSSLSGGLFVNPTDVSGAIKYLKALSGSGDDPPWTDADTIEAWASYACQNKQWIQELGGRVKFLRKGGEHPEIPGCDSIEIWQYPGKGLSMMRFMYGQVDTRGIEILYQTAAKRLLTNERGEIIGVKATSTGGGRHQEIYIRARKAVILCCGGFEDNEEMKLQYLRVYPVYFNGEGMGNTGDGIKMAQEVGADMWHMNCCSAGLVSKFPEFPMAFWIDLCEGESSRRRLATPGQKAAAGFITVDRHGLRYMNENFKVHAAWYQLAAFDSDRFEYPRVPSYHIFDQRRIDYGPVARMSGPAGPHQIYHWSKDNSAELRRGWILHDDTLTGLAGQIGIPALALEDTVQTWNNRCREGKDPEHGRVLADLVPIDRPPYYAIKVFPGGPNTRGGPKRNARAQVVNPFGEPVRRLYAAGECGSIYGMLYPSGGANLAECIAFGRIAGENAASEPRLPR